MQYCKLTKCQLKHHFSQADLEPTGAISLVVLEESSAPFVGREEERLSRRGTPDSTPGKIGHEFDR